MARSFAGAPFTAATLTGAALVTAAITAAIVPLPPAFVERVYSTGVYPSIQRWVTSISNRLPIALIDIMLLLLVVWLVFIAVGIPRLFRAGAGAALRKLVSGVILPAAGLYLWFAILWGFNYRRLPLDAKLSFDSHAVTLDAARSLASIAVRRVNTLHARAHALGWPEDGVVNASLAAAFSTVEHGFGVSGGTVPGRPKHSLLD